MSYPSKPAKISKTLRGCALNADKFGRRKGGVKIPLSRWWKTGRKRSQNVSSLACSTDNLKSSACYAVIVKWLCGASIIDVQIKNKGFASFQPVYSRTRQS